MADEDIEIPERADDGADAKRRATAERAAAERESPKREKPKRGRRWGLILLAVLVGLPLLLFALVSWITLSFSYSKGERAGYQQKISQKGWLCKTWEGEVALATMPGVAPEVFAYSVRDDAVAHELERLQGQRVSLSYEQHRFVPTACFGETEYFVSSVRTINDPLMQGGQVPGVPTTQPQQVPPPQPAPQVPAQPQPVPPRP